jgi:hypothetical protein
MTKPQPAPAPYIVTTVDTNGLLVSHQLMADSSAVARSTAIEHGGRGARVIRCLKGLAW